jgi:RNA polymerase sigma-70 factor (ECF subfamily)
MNDDPLPQSSGESHRYRAQRRSQILAALDSLPANQKAAMLLKHYEGLSYLRNSSVLDVTPKAVERLISRAGAALQSRLPHLAKD